MTQKLNSLLLYLGGFDGFEGLRRVLVLAKKINLRIVLQKTEKNKKLLKLIDKNKISLFSNKENINFDILLSIGYQKKISPQECGFAKMAVNIHAAILPKYRGRHGGIWAQIYGEKEIGVTSHLITNEFDNGKILFIAKEKISQETTSKEIKNIIKKCRDIIIAKILSNEKPCYNLSCRNEKNYLWRPRRPEDSIINWNLSSTKVFNLIRAISRNPIYAFSYLNGKKVYFKSAFLSTKKRPGLPGSVFFEKGKIFVLCGDAKLLQVEVLYKKIKQKPNQLFH